MSQQQVLENIKKLGGQATQRQLEQMMAKDMPHYNQIQLNKYVNQKLQLLRKWGEVTRDYKGTWFISPTASR